MGEAFKNTLIGSYQKGKKKVLGSDFFARLHLFQKSLYYVMFATKKEFNEPAHTYVQKKQYFITQQIQ